MFADVGSETHLHLLQNKRGHMAPLPPGATISKQPRSFPIKNSDTPVHRSSSMPRTRSPENVQNKGTRYYETGNLGRGLRRN